MTKMTKKKARALKAAWQAALAEGRVVRYFEDRLVSYPTIEARDAALAKNGFGTIVTA